MARILVLDDSALVLSATKLALEKAGDEVYTTSEPPVFFISLEKWRPDLALVDVSMPTLEGDAVVWIARAHQLHPCHIVLYSAKSPAELEKLVTSSGADGYICKTADEELLRRQVREVLEKSAKTANAKSPG
ncbi:MAG: response regulator [Myxococcaceae bacterium]|nr:response regulator [Myxococcaceae bacterium]